MKRRFAPIWHCCRHNMIFIEIARADANAILEYIGSNPGRRSQGRRVDMQAHGGNSQLCFRLRVMKIDAKAGITVSASTNPPQFQGTGLHGHTDSFRNRSSLTGDNEPHHCRGHLGISALPLSLQRFSLRPPNPARTGKLLPIHQARRRAKRSASRPRARASTHSGNAVRLTVY